MMKHKTISLYCNWNVFIDNNGNIWLPSVHAQYIKALKNIGFEKITLISKISTNKTKEHDFNFCESELDVICIPHFNSYTTSILKLPYIFKAFILAAKTNSDYFYIRTYEPFIWLLVLIQKIISPKTKLCMHYISDPKSAIFSNASSSLLVKVIRFLTFFPEYYLTNLSSLFCNITSNGPVPIKNTPFFVQKRIKEVIESAILEEDLRFLSDKIKIKPCHELINILYVGYIRPSKGIDYLVEAINLLVTENITNFKVTIVGSGEHLNNIKKKIIENNLEKYFYFAGYVKFSEELFTYYKESDIFVNVSPSETGPRVLLEAGIFQCYLISTKVGYASRIINNNGSLVDINSSIQIKNKIKNCILNIDLIRSNSAVIYDNNKLLQYTTENFFISVLENTKQ